MKKFETIRQAIKTLSEAQKTLKPQIKQSFTGERTSTNPVSERETNRYELRHLFQAYSVLKGKERQTTKRKEISESYVTKLVEKYGDNL
jgi:hypothetical protein